MKYSELKKTLMNSGKTTPEMIVYLSHVNDLKFLQVEQNISQPAFANLLNVDLNLLKTIKKWRSYC